jgi:hypothetical protein
MKMASHLKFATSGRKNGYMEVDLAIALAILALAIIPLAFSFGQEREMLRLDYSRAVADEVVDGEMEILAAGDWKNFPDGRQKYTVHSNAAANLPPGSFELTKAGNHLRLQWTPNAKEGVGAVVREITAQ